MTEGCAAREVQDAARRSSWNHLLGAPVDGAGLVAFRTLFGALLALGFARFLWQGWATPLFEEPTRFFKFWGLSWVPVWSGAGIRAHYATLIALSLGMAFGIYPRLCAALLLVGFAWVQAMDVTNYLNHYVLALWLLGWLALAPAPRLRAAEENAGGEHGIPRFWYAGLRFQVGVVYVFAAVAKVGTDWLVHGQPLGIWLGTRTHLPLIGPLFALPHVPLAMSWAGFLYDATIVFFLALPRTRPFAYATVLLFHGMTSALFDIGMFPGIMIVATSVFFRPDWPRRALSRARRGQWKTPALACPQGADEAAPGSCSRSSSSLPPYALPAFAGVVLLQIALPLRAFAYPGDVLWGEQGMRFSWRVMVREKSGSITYRVTVPGAGRTFYASPHDYLTWRQANEMSGQPDLILQLAHLIADDFRARGHGDVEVRVDAWASLNGRPPARLIDPDVDLARVEDGLGPATWILPPPAGAPLVRPLTARASPSTEVR